MEEYSLQIMLSITNKQFHHVVSLKLLLIQCHSSLAYYRVSEGNICTSELLRTGLKGNLATQNWIELVSLMNFD